MTPQEIQAMRQVVTAGMKVMFDERGFEIIKRGLESDKPVVDKLTDEALGLMRLLQDKANGGIPRQLLIPSAGLLLLEIGRLMADLGMPEPTSKEVQMAYEQIVKKASSVFGEGPAPREIPRAAPQPPAGLIEQEAA